MGIGVKPNLIFEVFAARGPGRVTRQEAEDEESNEEEYDDVDRNLQSQHY